MTRAIALTCFALAEVAAHAAPVLAVGPDTPGAEAYYRLLGQAETQYARGEDFSQTLAEIAAYRGALAPEIPRYERRFFDAVILARNGEREAALATLSAFADMLRIDSGVAECSEEADVIIVDGRKRRSPEAHNQMCWEFYLSYYDRPTDETLRRVARYWAWIDDLRSQIETP